MYTEGKKDYSSTLITRDEAVETLHEIISSGIISERLERKLEDIANVIEDEDKENGLGIMAWGMNAEDYTKLHTAFREDLWTKELEDELQAIYDSVKY